MANPNINSPNSCYANNFQVLLTTTAETQLVSNASNSGKIYLIDSIILTNISAAQITGSVTFYNAATNTGTYSRLAHALNIGVGASQLVSCKTHGVNLKEVQSIYANASAANACTCTVFWKEFT
jgi:hypothetical protein